MRLRQSRLAVASLIAVLGVAISVALPPQVQAQDAPASGSRKRMEAGTIGSYLVGRIARGLNDSTAAADYYRRALAASPDNETLLESAMLMEATEGDWAHAVEHARTLLARQPTHRLSRLITGIADFKSGNMAGARTYLQSTGGGAVSDLISVIGGAWISLAEGDGKRAVETVDGGRFVEGAQFFARYHRALILDIAGRKAEARSAYERTFRADPRVVRLTLAFARHAAASGDIRLARSILDEHIRRVQGTPHPEIKGLVDRFKVTEQATPMIESPREGFAELLYGVGEALSGDGGGGVGALYLQMALYLAPEQPFALAALANIYETTKRYDRAIEIYDRIPRGLAMQTAVDIRKAHNLNLLNKVEEAKVLLEKLAKDDPSDLRPLDALGNMLRGHKRYAEAIPYFNRIISLTPRPEKRHWVYYYARGTSYERIKRWPQAEADLLKALQLAPDQPLVLNYLGYSWVDQNKNLKQGLALIEKAVSLRPDDGYIIDSLGWAHFRLGNFKEAARYLERAVELKPEDATLNDHLGDALWRVGRYLEARYQWSQALTLNPEPEEAAKMQRKVKEGLPALKQSLRPVRKSRQANKGDARRRSQARGTPPPAVPNQVQ